VFCDVFANQYGGECTTQEAINVGDTDFSSLLSSIAADAPDFLFFPIFLPEGGLITQQARENPDLSDTALAGADGLLTPDFIDSAGEENAEGVFLSGPSLEFSGSFYKDDFLPAYEEQSGDEPASVFHAHAFDATNMVFEAIEQVVIETDDGGLLIPRTDLRDAVGATSEFAGITGSLTCDQNGDCQPAATIAVNQVEGGSVNNPIFEATLELEKAG
jgi:branched-chain amino acid transport system substrate-binding protein